MSDLLDHVVEELSRIRGRHGARLVRLANAVAVEMAVLEARLDRLESPARSVMKIRPLREVEQAAVEDAVRICDGDKREAARRLRIGRASLYRRLQQYARAAETRTRGSRR